MSLVIDQDGEYLSASGTTLIASTVGSMSVAIWVKRTTASVWQGLLEFNNSSSSLDGAIKLNSSSGNSYDHWVSHSGFDGSQIRNDSSGSATTSWQLIVATYDASTATLRTYMDSSTPRQTQTDPNGARNIAGPINKVVIGFVGGNYARAKLAHAALWNVRLSDADVGNLYNGGSGGNGMNPTAVQNSNLKFYAPLTSDATVSVGGVSLSATGSPTYDGADNPTVDAAGSGSTANGTTVSATSSLIAGSAISSAVIVTDPICNNAGTNLASTTIDKIVAIRLSDLALIATWTAQTTNGSAVLNLSHASLVQGVKYGLFGSDTAGNNTFSGTYTAA